MAFSNSESVFIFKGFKKSALLIRKEFASSKGCILVENSDMKLEIIRLTGVSELKIGNFSLRNFMNSFFQLKKSDI